MSDRPARRGFTLLASTAALLALGCGGGDGGTPTITEPDDPAPPVEPPVVEGTLECEIEGYPCSLSDVAPGVLEESSALADSALDMLAGGVSVAQAATWLGQQTGMAEIDADNLAIRFRLDGGRATWVFTEGVFAVREPPGAVASPVDQAHPRGVPEPAARDIVGPDIEEKSALVLNAALWDFGEYDDGAAVSAILSATRGYEGRVDFRKNAEKTSNEVGIGSFLGWDSYQVVHVSTHGTRHCTSSGCRAVLVASTVDALPLSGTPAEKLKALGQKGVETAKSTQHPGVEYVILTADFFEDQYPGGLDDTIVFLNACRSFGSQATDIVDALQGGTSVVFGWTETVYATEATAAAVKLYTELSDGGYPAEIAFDKLEGMKNGTSVGNGEPAPVLRMEGRSDTGDLRIREVVTLLNPSSGQELSPTSRVPIEGDQGDGVPDAAPYLVKVDGVLPEHAGDMVLHVSVDGAEADPVALSDGEVNDKDQWMVRGSIPLAYDLEEDRAVSYRAWVTLHSGGQSEHEAGATLTGQEPLMGYEWEMAANHTTWWTGFPSSPYTASAKLTLTFAEGQEVGEPNPRYVVTAGSVTYSYSHFLDQCTHSAGTITFEVTEDLTGGSALVFHTAGQPVTYSGYVWTGGPEVSVHSVCDGGEGSTRAQKAVNMWFNYDTDESEAVSADRMSITGTYRVETDVVHGLFIQESKYTMTRIR